MGEISMKEVGMKLASSKPVNVDDIVAAVEDAVRRAYALGRSDAMKRVVELAQADDPGLRAVALLGPAEPSRQTAPGSLEAPAQPAPAMDETPPDAPPAQHAAPDEAHQAASQGQPPASQPPAREPHDPSQESPRDPPQSVGSFLADFFYPLGSKK